MTERPEVRVLIVDDHQLLAQSLALGLFARGFRAEVSNDLSPGAVLDHAQIHASDLVLLDLEIGGEIDDGTTLVGPLTARGHRVLAEKRVVSEATVRTQVRAVLQKLGVTSQLEAVARARAADWG